MIGDSGIEHNAEVVSLTAGNYQLPPLSVYFTGKIHVQVHVRPCVTWNCSNSDCRSIGRRNLQAGPLLPYLNFNLSQFLLTQLA